MRKIKIEIKVKCWKDKQTGSWIIYSKRFDVSAYGTTIKQAKEMFDYTIDDILFSSKPKPTKVSK